MVETKEFSLNCAQYVKTVSAESMKKTFFYFILAILFVIGIGIYGYKCEGTLRVFYSWIPFLVIYGFLLFFSLVLFPIYMYKQKENTYSFTNRKYKFYDERLEVETEEGALATIPYKVIVKRRAGKDYFAFWETSLTAHIIPFDAFKSTKDVQFIKDLLIKNA